MKHVSSDTQTHLGIVNFDLMDWTSVLTVLSLENIESCVFGWWIMALIL